MYHTLTIFFVFFHFTFPHLQAASTTFIVVACLQVVSCGYLAYKYFGKMKAEGRTAKMSTAAAFEEQSK
jgi:intracellular septation protein A